MLALYLHWPFCLSKCPYCDFNSRVLPKDFSEESYTAAYLKELELAAEKTTSREITSIYFGGGTPSLMSPVMVEKLLSRMAKLWPVARTCEITIEANPTSSSREKFKDLKNAGINRLSLGVQSLRDERLRFLGRLHDTAQARTAIKVGLEVFDRFTFDLIYATQGQSEEEWRAELSEALSFGASHLSLYQLMIEEGSVFYKRPDKETLQAPEERAANLYEITQEMTEKAGLPFYETSNHARPGQESRHNLTYWHYDDYLGIGPGAHGRFVWQGKRWASVNQKSPEKWKKRILTQGQEPFSEILPEEAKIEALMMGLRLRDGISHEKWQSLFGESLEKFVPKEKERALLNEGLFESSASFFRLTPKGHEKLNAVLGYLL